MSLIDKYNEVETDEQLLQLEAALKDVQLDFNSKGLNVAHVILNIEADTPAIDKEIARLQTLKEHNEKAISWLRGYLKRSMEAVNSQKIESATVKISIVKNPPSLIIDDESKVSDKYKRLIVKFDDALRAEQIQILYPDAQITKEVKKDEIKKLLKEGIGVDGTHTETKTRLAIK